MNTNLSDRILTFNEKPWVYIASPYTYGDTLFNVQRQLEAKKELFEIGVTPIDPLPGSHLFETQCQPMHYQTWINYTLELESRCDAVLRLPGKSSGADGEVKAAINSFKIPVFYEVHILKESLQYWDGKRRIWNTPRNLTQSLTEFKTFDDVIYP